MCKSTISGHTAVFAKNNKAVTFHIHKWLPERIQDSCKVGKQEYVDLPQRSHASKATQVGPKNWGFAPIEFFIFDTEYTQNLDRVKYLTESNFKMCLIGHIQGFHDKEIVDIFCRLPPS